MNSKWFKRVVSAAGIAGGLLFFGAGAANAAIPVAGDDASTVSAQHIVQGPAGLVRPVGLQHAGDRFQPLGTAPEAGSGLEGALPSLGNPPTNGMTVDVPQIAGQVQQQAAPVTSKLGSLPEDGQLPLSGDGGPLGGLTGGLTGGDSPLSGITNGGLPEASPVTALPLSATSTVLPLSMPEDSTFTIAKGTELPVSGLGNDVRDVSGTNLGSTVGTTVAGQPALPSTGESTESAVPAADNLAGGTNVAGLPMNVTTPVLDQLAPSSPEDATLPSTLPAAPGSDPVSAVTGVTGNLLDGQGLPGALQQ
jgi:hypothetical protein